ncbi:MAG: glycosyltransferase [Phenylobacterium sp.]|uniref:tetratricopeptide repeat-containing glycosyltransferase family protein n=1 Tax=Phenylobacterium sp. TaxID=1871053 RepID=UPI0026019C40|nr:tetratricopeptide repeat-containing glycosyltransferase family protein [Phenylobacterium sp.]MDB5496440.1 glycosyltransferase [Phenylobacterium sp.]
MTVSHDQTVECVRRGDELQALGRLDEALASYRRAVDLQPGDFVAQLSCGNLLAKMGQHESALGYFDNTLQISPKNAAVYFNRAGSLQSMERFDEAISCYRAAISLRPDMGMAHHNLATCFLQTGDFETGFQEYEWRKSSPTFDDPRYALDRPWNGQDLKGKTLFIYPELYQGDLMQFCRYAFVAERMGARVRLAAPTAMHALLQSMSPTIELLPEDAVPAYDYQCALMSLPHAFGTTLATVPRGRAYFRAEPQRVARWRKLIGPRGFKIGVAWEGSAQAVQRSFPLAGLQGLATLPGVRLISLQKHRGLDQLESLPSGMSVESLGEDFDPGPDAFLDTAGAMTCCDLFITPDTSVAHLAGALRVRTWTALPRPGDWRWLVDRPDSPWYPTMRLFRQTSPGDWASVFAQMETALKPELRTR